MEAGREFELGGGPDAALLLHGLTGSTFEIHPLALRLQAEGFRCLAPVMAGHGGAPADLVGVPWSEWVAKAGRDLSRLAGARRTVVAGCSVGALVACALAHQRPEAVDALVLLAPAMALAPAGRLGGLLGRCGPLRRAVVPKGSGSDVRDAEMRRRNPCLPGVPLSAVAELERLAAHVDRLLPELRVPALVVAGGRDHTVTESGARRLARRIGSGPAPLVVLPESFHLVAIDVERERCCEVAVDFLSRAPLAARGAARRPRR
jgi:carboxylesterase